MDLRKYDELRKKINTKDFEGNNKALDKWLYGFSFVGNIGSIFFAYFLVFPALLKAISINLIDGFWGTGLAFLFANVFLVIFEIIKRYLVKNFSSDFVANGKKISAGIVGWFTISTTIVLLSFYLSLVGSKNLATTSNFNNTVAEAQINSKRDSLSNIFENKKMIYLNDNEAVRLVNNELRLKLSETPLNYLTARKEYQTSIDKNGKIINDNQTEINKIDIEFQQAVTELKTNLLLAKTNNKDTDTKNITLFIIIAIFVEVIIIGGLYFREWYEYNLYVLNQNKFEKIYQKKDRYRSLTTYIYNNGKVMVGDKVMSGMELKELFKEKTTIQNKFIDEYLSYMDKVGVFSVIGKRRYFAKPFQEALNLIENFDEMILIIENMK